MQTSKVLNYLDSPIVVPYFGVFIVAWTYLRHYQNIRILLSMLPLPSPFPDPVAAQLNSTLSTVSSNLHTITTPVLAPLATGFSTLFPETTSLLSAAYIRIAASLPVSGVSQFASIGPYTLNWDTQQYKCSLSQWITFLLLTALQAVNLFWLFFIIRILWRVLRTMGEETVDERSEFDSDEEVERRAELEEEKRADAAANEKAAAQPQVLPATNGIVKH
jgi:very-long-chain ceramide synthase